MLDNFLLELNDDMSNDYIAEEGWLKDAATWTKGKLVSFAKGLKEKLEKAWRKFLNWASKMIYNIKKALSRNKIMVKVFHLQKFKAALDKEDDNPEDVVDLGPLTTKINGQTYPVTVESFSDGNENNKDSKLGDLTNLENSIKNDSGNISGDELVDGTAAVKNGLDYIEKKINDAKDDMDKSRKELSALSDAERQMLKENNEVLKMLKATMQAVYNIVLSIIVIRITAAIIEVGIGIYKVIAKK